MRPLPRRNPGALGDAVAMAARAGRAPALAALSRREGTAREPATVGAALQERASAGRLSFRLEGGRFGVLSSPTRGGTVGRRTLRPHAQFAAPSFPPWGSACGGKMETEELADFSDPSAYGVPYAHASDLADPEIWRARVCAKVTAARAKEELRRDDQRREWKEQERRRNLRRRRSPYEAGDPYPWWEPLPPPPPTSAKDEARRCALASEAEGAARAWHAVCRSAVTRLAGGTLLAFARPEKARAPWVWVRPQEWADTKPRGDPSRPGAIILSGSTYWQMHIFDPVGLPLDQAAVACRARTAANVELARASIGRRLLGETYRDQKEENVIRELREALAAKLRAGRLVAIRGGTALAPEDFAPGAPLGNVNAWDGNSDVLVRPPAPPRREAPTSAPDAGTEKQTESQRMAAKAQEIARKRLAGISEGTRRPRKNDLFREVSAAMAPEFSLSKHFFSSQVWPAVATREMRLPGAPPGSFKEGKPRQK